MKRVLVIGATGALGKACISHLNSNCKYLVVPTSRSCDDAAAIQLDICNREQLSSAIIQAKPDLILNLAATFSSNFDESYAVNVAASHHLINILQENKLQTRVILIGSAAEYGIVKPEENPISESHILNPVSVYGLTKTWQTQLAGFYAGQGVDIVVARVFNLKGAGLSERLFIGRLEKQIEEILLGNKSFIELGNLTATRDYISVYEAAEQIALIAENGDSGQVYNVGSGIPIPIRELLMQYLSLNNLDFSIVQKLPELNSQNRHDVPVIYADISKTMQLKKHDRT